MKYDIETPSFRYEKFYSLREVCEFLDMHEPEIYGCQIISIPNPLGPGCTYALVFRMKNICEP
jgi:hypothetical protein